jgi:hypothetical protein
MTCPQKPGCFHTDPYSQERTAGKGMMVDYKQCHSGGDRGSYAYSDERTTASDGKSQADSSQE